MDVPEQFRGPNGDAPDRLRAASESARPDDMAEPTVAGVSLEVYVTILRSLADVGYDATKGPALAALEGVGETEWSAAVAGWNARMVDDPSVAHRFNVLYTQR